MVDVFFYIFIPTTTNMNIKNGSWLKIEDDIWYQNKKIQLKLDELFIVGDFDLKIWIPYGSDEVFEIFPRMIIKETSAIWKLNDDQIFLKIKNKLWENLSKNKTMFFILNRKQFQKNNNYWSKKLKSKYVYTTNAFIPKFNWNIKEFLKNIYENVENIRRNSIFNNNKEDIEKYKNVHFLNLNDKNNKCKKNYLKNTFLTKWNN